MKPWMLALMSGAPELVTKTFTSNETWPVPLGVTNLVTVVGKGGDGEPAREVYRSVYTWERVQYYTLRYDGRTFSTVVESGARDGKTPDDYCTPSTFYSSGAYTEIWYCFFHKDVSGRRTIPATTGASATGFGKTFPGGVGGPASAVTYSDVAVNPGQSYNIVVPPSGSITISYYR